jgi:hypothetical protein
MKIQILNRWTAAVVFEHDAENNTMKLTLEAAVRQCVNLRGSNLRGSNLRDSNLSGVPRIPNIHQAVYQAAAQPNALDMCTWHACETTHCRAAGWVVTLAGEGGKALEWAMGPATAATLIYLASDPERWQKERLPDFYCNNEAALADMQRMAEEEAAKPQPA